MRGSNRWPGQLVSRRATRVGLAKLDRKRPKHGSHNDRMRLHNQDTRITRIGGGRTRLAHTRMRNPTPQCLIEFQR